MAGLDLIGEMLTLRYVPLTEVRRWDRRLEADSCLLGMVACAQRLKVRQIVNLCYTARFNVVNVQASSFMDGLVILVRDPADDTTEVVTSQYNFTESAPLR